MNLEALWPSSVKQCIDKYRAEGSLNHAVVERIRKHYMATFIVLGLSVGLFCWVNEIIPAVLMAALLPVGPWLEVRMLFNNYMIAYAKGMKRDVEVVWAGVGRYGVQKIIYKELDGEGGEACIKIPGTPFIELEGFPVIKKIDLPQKGGVISIYQDKERKFQAMPDMLHLKKAYSLSTSVF